MCKQRHTHTVTHAWPVGQEEQRDRENREIVVHEGTYMYIYIYMLRSSMHYLEPSMAVQLHTHLNRVLNSTHSNRTHSRAPVLVQHWKHTTQRGSTRKSVGENAWPCMGRQEYPGEPGKESSRALKLRMEGMGIGREDVSSAWLHLLVSTSPTCTWSNLVRVYAKARQGKA